MNVRVILIACRVLLGLVFLVACIHKILFPEAFALSISRYQLLPDALINVTAITLPWIELVVAVTIMFSLRFKDAAAALMLAMLGVFTLAIVMNLARGLDVACGCFTGAAETETIGWDNVMRNLGYMFLAVLIVFEDDVRRRLEGK